MRVRGEPILRQHDRRPAEAVRFDDIRSRLEVFPVNIQNDVRARSNQVFVASLERSSAKILRIQVALLQHCPHRPVKHEDPVREQLPQGSGRFVQVTHPLEGVTPNPGSLDEMLQIPKKSSVSGHPYFTQVSRRITIYMH